MKSQKLVKVLLLKILIKEKNLIDAIKQIVEKILREKTGKKPFTNVNIARI